jgi:hypothetical protein
LHVLAALTTIDPAKGSIMEVPYPGGLLISGLRMQPSAFEQGGSCLLRAIGMNELT